MAVSFYCSCGKRLRGRDDNAGKRVRCPRCGSVAIIPSSESGSAVEEETDKPAILEIERIKKQAAMLRDLSIVVDGEKAGLLGNGESEAIELAESKTHVMCRVSKSGDVVSVHLAPVTADPYNFARRIGFGTIDSINAPRRLITVNVK
jgi:predicted RNA-binding Zn-ribbon protein involved in translation (DUF1610 family)